MSSVLRDTDFNSPQEIKTVLHEKGLTVKKRFGQNFLINSDARRRIVDALDIRGGELVWEIGPGIGSLTNKLVEQDIRLVVFEIDRGFVRVLKETYASNAGFSIVEGDFIKTWREARDRSGKPDLVVGNLPYSCASAIFLSLIEGGINARRIICTVQREAAIRMTASPGSPDYSSFTVLCALTWRIERLGDLKAGSFYPPPRVQSTILSLEPRERSSVVTTAQLLAGVREIFAGRRKTIRNNLKMAVSKSDGNPHELLIEAGNSGFDLDKRAETLSPERVEDLAAILCKYLSRVGGSTGSGEMKRRKA